VIDQPDRPDVPHSFDTDELVASSEPCVVSQAGLLTLEPDDHVMPDCILDTALESVTEQLDAPVHGILRMNTSFFHALGLRYGAVARNHAVGDALDRRIRGYDTSGDFVGTSILDLPTEAVADTPRWNAALAEHVQALADRGAQVVINGCSAVDVADQAWAIPVIDPTQLAIGCFGLAQNLGIHTT
jgi:Asp/Glu/hydantoin racemase